MAQRHTDSTLTEHINEWVPVIHPATKVLQEQQGRLSGLTLTPTPVSEAHAIHVDKTGWGSQVCFCHGVSPQDG
jgi:hypothetical protein